MVKGQNREGAAARSRKAAAIAKALNWSAERMASFIELVAEYRKIPSIENYVRIRIQFPEFEIQVARFGGLDPLTSIEKELKKQNIDSYLVAGAFDADEASIDALSLRLMQCLIAREELPTQGPGHIQLRREAISDALVNYLIAMVLEAFDWNEHEVRVPASLIVLIRHQLTGSHPDFHARHLARENTQNLALMAAQLLAPGEMLSINKLVKIGSLPRTTAARLLKDKEFLEYLSLGQKWVAGGLFKKH